MVSTIDGIDEDEHEIELRVDHALVKRFTIGGKFKGPDPGVLIAVPEDDMYGPAAPRLPHQRRRCAGSPGAGQGGHAAGRRRRSPTPRRSPERAAAAAADSRSATAPTRPASTCSTSPGPFDGKTPADTPSRQQIFTCQPASAREEEAVRAPDPHHAGAARLPAAGHRRRRRSRSSRSTREGRARATSTPASSARSKRCCRRRSSCSASSASRPAPSRAASTA